MADLHRVFMVFTHLIGFVPWMCSFEMRMFPNRTSAASERCGLQSTEAAEMKGETHPQCRGQGALSQSQPSHNVKG